MDADSLAAIDIGSNSFRLELARIGSQGYRRIEYLKRVVRLGAGLDEHSRLSDEAMRRGLECLAEFSSHLRHHAPRSVRAVATQTLREAANRNDFIARAEKALGFPIEIISGREEARLIYRGVSYLQPAAQRRLVIDIGGRSTELILGQGADVLAAESFPVGSVGLSMRCFADGRFNERSFAAAQVVAAAQFEEALQTFAAPLWQDALGSSGTVGAASDVLRASGVSDGRIDKAALDWLLQQCLRAGSAQALSLSGLKEDRRAVIGGGVAILRALFDSFDIGVLWPTKGALRQGLIVELNERLMARTDAQDLRSRSVRLLQQRFAADAGHAARVRETALALWDAVEVLAEPEARLELAWAAELHELGMVLSHHDHHRHSAYMVGHADAPGFSQSQLRRVANLVLGQRGGLKKMDDALREPRLAWQLLCLRLAVIAHHARRATVGSPWHAQRQGGSELRLQWALPAEAAAARTRYLLEEEASLWQRQGPLRLQLDFG